MRFLISPFSHQAKHLHEISEVDDVVYIVSLALTVSRIPLPLLPEADSAERIQKSLQAVFQLLFL